MSTNRILLLPPTLAACLYGAAALAQAPASAPPANPLNETAKTMAGAYEFSNADRDRRCTVDLKTDLAGAAGLKLEFDKACVTVFPFVKDIVGWTIAENDFLRLHDAKGRPVLELSEVEHGIFEVPRPGEGVLFLQSVAAVDPPPPSVDQMAGEWDVVRDGGKICSITLVNKPAGEGFLLSVKPGCDASVTRFSPSSWQMDRSELLLKGAGAQTWRFEENDDKTWQRVPETRDPISLVKR
jgi:protease inhibitor Inh